LQPQFIQWEVKIYTAKTNSFIASLPAPSLKYSVSPRYFFSWSLWLKHLKIKIRPIKDGKIHVSENENISGAGGGGQIFLFTEGRGSMPERRVCFGTSES